METKQLIQEMVADVVEDYVNYVRSNWRNNQLSDALNMLHGKIDNNGDTGMAYAYIVLKEQKKQEVAKNESARNRYYIKTEMVRHMIRKANIPEFDLHWFDDVLNQHLTELHKELRQAEKDALK